MPDSVPRHFFIRGFGARPRRHRVARTCAAAVGIALTVISVCSLIPDFAADGLFLGVFRTDTPLVIFRLVAGIVLLVTTFLGAFVWGRVFAIVFGLFFGLLGLLGGLSSGAALGIFGVSVVDNSFHVLLCTVLVGVGALSLDRFAEVAG
jgi:hypothetical protein